MLINKENLTREEIKNYPLPKLLSVIFRSHNMYLHNLLSETEINFGEFPFIINLYYNDHVTQKDLADEFLMNEGTVARAMKKLEHKKFIKRVKNPNNKRENIISLTDKGRNFAGQILDLDNDWEEMIFKPLTDDEIIEFKSKLIKMQNNSIEINENINTED
jgi:DNA-binding MarR family transcriptional regulator